MDYIKALKLFNIKDAEDIGSVLNTEAPRYGISTKKEAACFVSNSLVETDKYTTFKENLNYSTEARLKFAFQIFRSGKYNARDYLNNPKKLANLVYDDANRQPGYKLGNTRPGDGWALLGSGDLQITGGDNFKLITKHNLDNIDFYNNPYLAQEGSGRRIASLAWWKGNNMTRKCNTFAQSRAAVNAKSLGLKEGQIYFDKIMSSDV